MTRSLALALTSLLTLAAACGDDLRVEGDAGVAAADAAPVSLDAPARADAPPPLGGGLLRVVALDAERAQPVPARVIVTALPPTPPVAFDVNPATGGSSGGVDGVVIAPDVIGAPEGVYLTAGDGTFKVPPGSYRVFVTRGPEYEAHIEEIVIDDERGVTVAARLLHSVDARGWLAADTHVHSGRSFDSVIGLATRVVSEVSVGVGLIITTDHNIFTDLQPVVEALGYEHLTRAIVGDEYNFLEGHGGAFPVPYLDAEDDGGATALGFHWEGVRDDTLTVIAPRLRALATHPAVSVNHPRMGTDLGYFNNLSQYGPFGWWPPEPLPAVSVLDAIEVLNGYLQAPGAVAVVLRDWFFLLSSGHRLAALGGADTHQLKQVLAGFPRTWIRLPSDDPFEVTGQDVGDAVRAGRTIVSTGPFARLAVNGRGVGDLVGVTGGAVSVTATVDAPAWMTVDAVQVWVNSQLVREVPIAVGSRPLYHATFTLPVPAGDGWIVLVAKGSRTLPPALVGDYAGDVIRPLVITSPIYLDGDGDGQWRPQIATPDPGPLTLFQDTPWRGAQLPPAPRHEAPLGVNPATWE